MVPPVCQIPVLICCAKRRATSFTHVLEGDKPVHRGGSGDVNGDGDGDGAVSRVETRTGVEANEGAYDGNGHGAGTVTRTAVETRGRTQDGNRNGSGDGNESSSGDGKGNEDGNGDGIEEGGGEVKKRKKPHKSCRRRVGNGGDLGGKSRT